MTIVTPEAATTLISTINSFVVDNTFVWLAALGFIVGLKTVFVWFTSVFRKGSIDGVKGRY